MPAARVPGAAALAGVAASEARAVLDRLTACHLHVIQLVRDRLDDKLEGSVDRVRPVRHFRRCLEPARPRGFGHVVATAELGLAAALDRSGESAERTRRVDTAGWVVDE